MNRKLLVSAICMGLVVAGSAYADTSAAPALPQAQAAQTGAATSSQSKKSKEKPQELKAVIVTGSLIPTAEIETATPVVKITAQDMQQRGFTNVYQALRALPLATGQVQGQQAATFAGFTPGAQTISLLGLPPSFTLFMIDGQPMTSFPLAYNGQSNITSISNIPMSMISQVQIVPGGNSSIYGSAAIAGVVNFITKKNVKGIDLDYQSGGYQKGGGYSQRLSVVGGYNHHKFGMTYGVQFLDQQPIFGFDRPFTESSFSNPNADLRGVPFDTTSVFNPFTGIAIDPDTLSATGCGPLSREFGNTTVRFATMGAGAAPGTFAPDGGYTCGSPNANGYGTLMNKSRTGSVYLTAHYQLTSNAELYANLLGSVNSLKYNNGSNFFWWEPNVNAFYSGGDPGIIFNANPGVDTLQQPQYIISPEEAGTAMLGATDELQKQYQFWGGVRGSFGSSNWRYNAFYVRSQFNDSVNAEARVTAKVDDFFGNMFLGPELGTTSGFPIYRPDYGKFFQTITPSDVNSFVGIDHTSSESYTQNLNLQVTNDDLFSLPAGDLGVAGILKVGDEQYTQPANPLVVAHEFWGLTAASAEGRRNNYAAAIEVHVPILKILSADLSYREDHYADDGGATTDHPTYKVAFALRPTSTLLFRANYATAFQMPNMSETFLGPSGAFGFVTDYYQCELQHPGTPFSDCSAINSNSINPQITITNQGNPDLVPITARSWGGGIVWSPWQNLNVSADYYDVRVRNEVQFQSSDTLLLNDAQCLLGELDMNSAECQQALAQVTRTGANAPVPFSLTGVTVHPVNVAHERVNGIMAEGNYTLDTGRFGRWGLQLSYNVTLNHTLQPGPGFPNYDLLHNPYYDALYSQGGSAIGPEFKTIVNGSITWTKGPFATTVSAVRYGHMPNLAMYGNPTQNKSFGAYMLKPWVMYNATLQYRITPNLAVTGTVDNLFNTMPPHDSSQTGWPYYDVGAYNVWGRSYFLSLHLHI